MSPETKNCQNCKNNFVIDSDDFDFYNKIKVPPPTFCPECRLQRRLSFNNLNTLYKSKCALCSSEIVSLYSENNENTVYCNPCWWSDKWDWRETAMEYNPNIPFIEQIIELKKKTPFMALEGLFPSFVNTKYTNNSAYQKDCYMTFYTDYAEKDIYTTFMAHTKEVTDSLRIKESELLYECIGAYKCYKCYFSEEIENCVEAWFCRNCNNCNNCFGCSNLRGKSYCIFNKQYSKEEYFEIIESFGLNSRKNLNEIKEKVYEFWLSQPQRSYIGNSLNLNVTNSEVTYESKNTDHGFMVTSAENSKYVQLLSLPSTKDCYDYTGWGAGAELIYESFLVGEGTYNTRFSVECWPAAYNLEYSYYCTNSPKNCFGCVNTKSAEYCILNKQYSKEEYEKLKEQIIKDMTENPFVSKAGHIYKYGEMLPPEFSPFGYNETLAQDYFPIDKEGALNSGFNWYKEEKKEYKFTMGINELPDSSSDVNESISNQVIECSSCNKAYNITSLEVERLNKLELPYPDKCWKCRSKNRFDHSPKPKIYKRTCNKCSKDITTSYSPDRPEIVYCEKCYQQEVN